MSRPRRKTLRAAAAASCAALVLAGCANDSDDGDDAAAQAEATTPDITQTPTPGDTEQITALTIEVLTSDDLKRKCEELTTSGFVLAVFGSQEACQTPDEEDDDSDPTGARVADVVITGDSAVAVVNLVGGDTDGAGGVWRFSKDPGGGWRLAEWSIDYLRSVLAAGFGPNYEADSEDDPFGDEVIRSCFTAKLQSLDDQNFRTVMYSLIADRDDSNELLGQALIDCGYTDSGSDLPPADSEVRAGFEASYRASASQARPGADLDCELAQLRESVTDAEIAAAENDEDAYDEVAAAAADAQADCAQSRT